MDNDTTNYQRITDRLLSEIPLGERPRLLLHDCCAPCGSYVLTYLTAYFDIDILFYNPNIYPKAEYDKRLNELKKLCAAAPFSERVRIIEGVYDPKHFADCAVGLENEPEGKKRCEACFRLRLKEAAVEAKNRGTDWFATTLSVSPHKNAALLNQIGGELEKEYGVRYLYADFKKRGGYQQSVALSKQFDLYRQDYCGCVYSMKTAHPAADDDGTSLPRSNV